ncbi:hypothetical protein [Achromobacter aegrifaciens]
MRGANRYLEAGRGLPQLSGFQIEDALDGFGIHLAKDADAVALPAPRRIQQLLRLVVLFMCPIFLCSLSAVRRRKSAISGQETGT